MRGPGRDDRAAEGPRARLTSGADQATTGTGSSTTSTARAAGCRKVVAAGSPLGCADVASHSWPVPGLQALAPHRIERVAERLRRLRLTAPGPALSCRGGCRPPIRRAGRAPVIRTQERVAPARPGRERDPAPRGGRPNSPGGACHAASRDEREERPWLASHAAHRGVAKTAPAGLPPPCGGRAERGRTRDAGRGGRLRWRRRAAFRRVRDWLRLDLHRPVAGAQSAPAGGVMRRSAAVAKIGPGCACPAAIPAAALEQPTGRPHQHRPRTATVRAAIADAQRPPG